MPARWTANAKQSIDERKGSGQAKGDKDGGGGADGDGDSGGLDGLLRLPPMPAAQVLAAAAAAADEKECAGSEGSEDREAVQHVQARLDRRDLKREVTRTLDTLGKGEDANRLGDMDGVCDLEKLQRGRDEATRQLRLWNEGVVDPADDLLAVPDIVGTGRAAARGDAAAGGKGAAGAHLVTLPNLALQDLEHVDIALSEDDEVVCSLPASRLSVCARALGVARCAALQMSKVLLLTPVRVRSRAHLDGAVSRLLRCWERRCRERAQTRAIDGASLMYQLVSHGSRTEQGTGHDECSLLLPLTLLHSMGGRHSSRVLI